MVVRRLASLPLYTLMVGVGAIAVIVAVDGWRTAALASLAGGVVASTRVRYSDVAAVAVMAATAVLVSGGKGLG